MEKFPRQILAISSIALKKLKLEAASNVIWIKKARRTGTHMLLGGIPRTMH